MACLRGPSYSQDYLGVVLPHAGFEVLVPRADNDTLHARLKEILVERNYYDQYTKVRSTLSAPQFQIKPTDLRTVTVPFDSARSFVLRCAGAVGRRELLQSSNAANDMDAPLICRRPPGLSSCHNRFSNSF